MKTFAVLILVFFACSNLTAQRIRWHPENSTSLRASAMIKHDGKVIAVNGTAIIESGNLGQTWDTLSNLRDFIPLVSNGVIVEFASNTKYLFMVARPGFYRSSDGGKHWESVSGPFGASGVYHIGCNDSILIASPAGKTLRSLDNGTTWDSVSDKPIYNIVVKDKYVFGFFVGITNSILVSGNSGKTFTDNSDGLPPQGFQPIVLSDNRVFVLGNVANVYEYNFTTSKWDLRHLVLGTDAIVAPISSVVVKDSTWYVAMDNSNMGTLNKKIVGVYCSTNNGKTWTQDSKAAGHLLLLDMDTHILALTNFGIMKTTVGANAFTQTQEALANQTMTNCTLTNVGIYSQFNNGEGYYYGNVNTGSKWRKYFNPQTGTINNVYMLTSTFSYYNQIVSNANDSVYMVHDGIHLIKNTGLHIRATAMYDNQLYTMVGAKDKIYVSSDDGVTWNSNDLPDATPLALFRLRSDFVCVTTNGCYRTPMQQVGTWNKFTDVSLKYCYVNEIYPNKVFGVSQNSYTYSTDSAHTWNSTPLPETDIIAFTVLNDSIPIVLSASKGVYASFNNGKTWSVQNTGLPGIPTTICAERSNMICGVPNNGAFEAVVDFTSDVSLDVEQQHLDVYPTPATNSINIQLPEDASIKLLEIFDSLGKRVYSEPIYASNTVKTVSTSALANGTYYVRIHAGNILYSTSVVVSK